MTYQLAFLAADVDDPAALLEWLTEAAAERLGYAPTFTLTPLVDESFPAEWAIARGLS